MKYPGTVSLISFLIASTATLQAQITYLSDPFLTGGNDAAGEYTTGGFLGQAPDTTGFDPADPWSGDVGGGLDVNGGANGDMNVVSGGLSYAGLTLSAGGGLDYTRTNSGGGFVANKGTARDFSTGLSGSSYTALWGAMLFNFNAAYEGTFNFEWETQHQFTVTVDATNGDTIEFTDAFPGSGGDPAADPVSLTADTTYLMLFRSIGAGASDTLDVWLNPDLSGGEAGLGNGNVTDFTGNYRVNMENFGTEFTADLSFGGGANQTIVFDEIRLGDSYNAVVPEPGTFALLMGLAGGLLTFWRRRL